MNAINIQPNNVVAYNQLHLAVQTDWQNWISLVNIPVYGDLLQAANIKLIRQFDFRETSPKLMPCIVWDESTKTGVWDWTNVDAFAYKVFEIGAEPLFCLGYARPNIHNYIPPEMAVNPTTELPYPDSYATYAREWVKHFEQIGLPVRFYEIMNEPFAYFGWTPDTAKLRYFTDLWSVSYEAMKTENPQLIIGNDFNTRKQVLDYWLSQGIETDSLNFHKYDGFGEIDPADPNYRTDTQIFDYAESRLFTSDPLGRSVMESQQLYHSVRGKTLPIINSESNVNAHWETGSDIRNVDMAGAVWLALVLRKSVLNGLNYHVHFQMASSKNWETSKPFGGAGFGFINSDDRLPWYPYYVYYIIGRNLEVNDPVFETTSSDGRIRAVAWKNMDKLKVLLINKSHDIIDVSLEGLHGKLSFEKIDETIPYTEATLQTGEVQAEFIVLNGYTVMVLEQEYAPRKWAFKHWQDGDTNPSKTIIV